MKPTSLQKTKRLGQKFLSAFLVVGIISTFLFTLFTPTVSYGATDYQVCLNQGWSVTYCHNQGLAGDPALNGATPNGDSSLSGAAKNVIGGIALSAVLNLINAILLTVQTVIAGFMLLAGLILDKVISYSITGLATHIAALPSINTAWRLIRDLANMSFIFVLLYYAIMMIFGRGDAKKIIAPIIIAAILINFSLFFTKLIIDASNVVAMSFYNSIIPQGPQTIAGVSVNDAGLSAQIINKLNLTGLYDKAIITNTDQTQATISLVAIIGGCIFMLIATFVFLAMAVLFLIRYILFVFLLILSPLGYIAGAIPGLKGLSNTFWETLMGQAMFAPLFMIMMWIVFTVMTDVSKTNLNLTSTSLGVALKNPLTTNAMDVLLNYFIITGLLIGAIILSKKHASRGGMVSSKLINAGTGFLGGALFGGASYLGTRTFGKAGSAISENEKLKEAARNNKGISGFLARTTLRTSQKAASSSFDARSAPGVSGLLKTTNLGDFGKGNAKKGYAGVMADKQKKYNERDKAFLESLKPSDEAVNKAKEELKEKMKDPVFQNEEEHKKSMHLAELDAEIARKKKEIDFDRIETERVAAEQGVLMATTAKNTSERKLRDLQNNLRNTPAADAATKKALGDQIQAEQENISALDKSLDKGKKLLAEKKEVVSSVQKLIDVKDKDTIDWMSPEFTDLIARAGGTKANNLEGKENVNIRKTGSAYEQAVQAEAKRIGNKSFRKVVMFNPSFNKERARKIAKLAKQDTDNEMAKAMKKYLKEKNLDKDEDEETPTPPTPTPPPTEPPTTT